jgi:selenocysteine lyase/cysteine desulfurase
VRYVNGSSHWFESDLERREEAGTPDVLGAIRAALALQLHSQLSPHLTHAVPVARALRAVRAWQHAPTIQIVGSDRSAFWDESSRLPLVSFNVVVPVKGELARDAKGGAGARSAAAHHKSLHPQFVAALLNDLFGIQVCCRTLDKFCS